MKSDSLYLMDQKQYNFIEKKEEAKRVSERASEQKKIEKKRKQNSKETENEEKKTLFRFYWHLLSS